MNPFEKSILINKNGVVNYNIQALLEMIRKRPGMFIGSMDLRSLQVYIGGFMMSALQLGAENINKKDFNNFHEFVRAKLGYFESTAGWANMIINSIIFKNIQNPDWDKVESLKTKLNGREQIDVFYQLIDEFYK